MTAAGGCRKEQWPPRGVSGGHIATGEDRKQQNICYRIATQEKSDPASAKTHNAPTGSND